MTREKTKDARGLCPVCSLGLVGPRETDPCDRCGIEWPRDLWNLDRTLPAWAHCQERAGCGAAAHRGLCRVINSEAETR